MAQLAEVNSKSSIEKTAVLIKHNRDCSQRAEVMEALAGPAPPDRTGRQPRYI